MALPLIKSPMTSCSVLSSLRGRQVDPVAGAEDLRLGHRSGARTDAGHGIVTAIVGEQYIYGDCPLSTGNVVTHEIEAMRTQGNFLILLSPFNNNSLIFPSRNGRHHGHRHGHRHVHHQGQHPTNPEVKTNNKIINAIFFIYFTSVEYFDHILNFSSRKRIPHGTFLLSPPCRLDVKNGV